MANGQNWPWLTLVESRRGEGTLGGAPPRTRPQDRSLTGGQTRWPRHPSPPAGGRGPRSGEASRAAGNFVFKCRSREGTRGRTGRLARQGRDTVPRISSRRSHDREGHGRTDQPVAGTVAAMHGEPASSRRGGTWFLQCGAKAIRRRSPPPRAGAKGDKRLRRRTAPRQSRPSPGQAVAKAQPSPPPEPAGLARRPHRDATRDRASSSRPARRPHEHSDSELVSSGAVDRPPGTRRLGDASRRTTKPAWPRSKIARWKRASAASPTSYVEESSHRPENLRGHPHGQEGTPR